MIKNQKQYQGTKKLVSRLEETIAAAKSASDYSSNKLSQFQTGALEYQLRELRNQIHEYEALRSGHIKSIQASGLTDIGKILIQARIANDLTQTQLAEKLGTYEQQIQRWESNEYQTTSLETIIEIIELFEINIVLGRVSLVKTCVDLPNNIDPEKLKGAVKTISQRKCLFEFC